MARRIACSKLSDSRESARAITMKFGSVLALTASRIFATQSSLGTIVSR